MTSTMLSHAQSEQLYGMLVDPPMLFDRWSLRRRRGGVGEHALKAEVYGVIGSLELLASAPVPEIEVHIREGNEDSGTCEEEVTDEGLDVLLKALRAARISLKGQSAEQMLRAARLRFSLAATEYEVALTAALAKLDQIEAFLVLLGAGTDEDAHLAENLIPVPVNILAGASVRFQL